MRRTLTIGILAAALATGAMRTPAATRFVSAARQFHALKSARSIGPIERLLLSLAMTS